MVQYGGSVPQVVIRQATQPDASSYLFWVDTTDGSAYSSNGSAWTKLSSGADAQGWESAVSQVILELLKLSAEGTLTAPDYNSMFVDYFSDADGQQDTIDTGNTTATFAGSGYSNGTPSGTRKSDCTAYAISNYGATTPQDFNDNNAGTLWQSGEGTAEANWFALYNATAFISSKIHILMYDSNSLIQDFTIQGSNNSTNGIDGDWTVLKTVTSNASTDADFTFSNATAYKWYKVDVTNWANGEANGLAIKTYDIFADSFADKVIQTNAQALSFAPAYVLVHAKDKSSTGTGSITYDISFDGGSTWDSTDNVLDAKTSVTDGSSKNMVIILNLNAGASSGAASIDDYEVILWSS